MCTPLLISTGGMLQCMDMAAVLSVARNLSFDMALQSHACASAAAITLMQIIAQTAKFVRGNGNQVEVLLRVKHGANPNFAFLMKHDRLFPYYRWAVASICSSPLQVAIDWSSS